MALVQRSADQQQMDSLNVLQKLASIRDQLLDILRTFKQQHETVGGVLILFWPHETCSVLRKPRIRNSETALTTWTL